MRQSRGSFRTVVVAAVSLALVVGAAFSAWASHGKDGDPISEVPDLFADGASYGTITNHDDSTEPNGKAPAGGCGYPDNGQEGASAYKIQADIGTKVGLDVTDDVAGASLRCVALYREHQGGDSLPALYGFREVGDYEVHSDDCNTYNSVCRMKWVVPETDDYYLVFWPHYGQGQDSNANYATFRFSISIRRPTRTKLAIEDASKPGDSKCFGVGDRDSVTANVQVTDEATGNVKFRLERRRQGKWKLVSTADVALEDSKASHEQDFERPGHYALRAVYLGDDVNAPSKSKKVCIQVAS